MRYLAIDLGSRRTGLAVGDDTTRIVTPLKPIVTANRDERDRLLRRVIDEQLPGALVVGLPKDMSGKMGRSARAATQEAHRLGQHFALPVQLMDERLTSFAADQQMARSGMTHRDKKQRRDALAAAALLRDYFATLGPNP